MAASGFAQIDGKNIAFRVAPADDPTLVLMSGHNTPMSSWDALFPEIERFGSVLTFDRLGIGKSDRPDTPQHGLAVLGGLEAVTAEAGLKPPFILVAHSLGGLYAHLFARKIPDQIAGIVFVESAHPDQARLGPPKPGLLLRLLQLLPGGGFRKDPNSEFNGVNQTLAQLEAAGPFPAIPVAVVTGAKKMPFVPQDQFDLHQNKQRVLAQISPDAAHIIAERSGHAPQISEPEVVIKAIASVVDRVRAKV